MKNQQVLTTLIASIATLTQSVLAETLMVPEQYPNIQSAINASQDGDVISVGDNHIEGFINGLTNITIAGRTEDSVTIDAQGLSACVAFPKSEVTFKNINFENADDATGAIGSCRNSNYENCHFKNCTSNSDGGGVVSTNGNIAGNGNYLFRNCTFENCTGARGGALSDGGNNINFVIDSCTFTSCSALSDGGAIWVDRGRLEVVDSFFYNCSSEGKGGAIVAISLPNGCTIKNTVFEDCTARFTGGAAFIEPSNSNFEIQIENCQFTRNSSTDSNAGGIYLRHANSPNPRLSMCTFTMNTASSIGGGAYADSCSITSCDFTENTAGNQGGGLYARESTVTSSNFSLNVGSNGGGCYLAGTSGAAASVAGCTFNANTSTTDIGGGLASNSSENSYTNNTFCENVPAPVSGGLTDIGLNVFTCSASGSCCIESSCIESTEEQCLEAGGIFEELGCNERVCPSSDGACCLPTGCVIFSAEQCFSIGGSFAGNSTDCDTTECPSSCEGDATGNGIVDYTDLISVLSNWGPCSG